MITSRRQGEIDMAKFIGGVVLGLVLG